MQKVEITWIDAQSSMDAYTIEELKDMKLLTTKSCGYLIHKTKDKDSVGVYDIWR